MNNRKFKLLQPAWCSSSIMRNKLPHLVIAAFVLICQSVGLHAQKPGTNPSSGFSRLYSTYWSTVNGVRSVVELHNSSRTMPLTVTPVLYAATGSPIALKALTIPALTNAKLDINRELATAGQAGEQTGSAEFSYPSSLAGSLIAETLIEDAPHSLAYTITSAQSGALFSRQHAVFWLPGRGSYIYIALQNISDRPLQITPEIQINHVKSALAPVSLGPKQSTVIAAPDELLAPAFAAQRENGGVAGGITLAHNGAPGGLNALGWIENTGTGFSTMMSFTDPARVKSNELMATQVLLGDQHALLKLPEPVHISSHIVLRNVGEKVAWFTRASLYLQKASGTPQSQPLTLPALGPGEVFDLDLATLPAALTVRDAIGTILLEYDGAPPGSVVGRVFGVSADTALGFYTALEPYAGWSFSEAFWTIEGNMDSVLTVANLGSAADEITVTLTHSKGQNVIPLFSLAPFESRTISVRQLATLLPADFGGFSIAGSSRASRMIVKEHVVDPVRRAPRRSTAGLYTFVTITGIRHSILPLAVAKPAIP